MIFAGEKVVYEGKTLTLPRPGGQGKALRIDHAPASIPIYLATLGPKALAYTGAAADDADECVAPADLVCYIEQQ